MTCATCRYWKRAGEGKMGDCRRRPPTLCYVPPVSKYTDGEWRSYFPDTTEIDWCGEYSEAGGK